jgi:hypothetical protein
LIQRQHHRNFRNIHRREQNGEPHLLQVLHKNYGEQNCDDKDDDGFDAHNFLPLIGYHKMRFFYLFLKTDLFAPRCIAKACAVVYQKATVIFVCDSIAENFMMPIFRS